MKHYFYPEDYGATADGKVLDTAALQTCIDSCNASGGGVVYLGAGAYLTGTIDLKAGVELHLSSGCRIVASTDINDYKDMISDGFYHEAAIEGTAKYLIGASHAQKIAITGPGEIDGRGCEFYNQTEFRKNGQFAARPDWRIRLVMFHKCSEIRLEDTSYIDSPCWTMWLMVCDTINVHRVKIRTDKRIINGDGIDFDSCKNVTVSDCIMDTEDDCLVFRAIQRVHNEPAVCENISVTNCVLSSLRQSIRISCPNDHITRNMVFSNLTMNGSNGIWFHFPARFFKEDCEARAEVSNILFSNISINCSGIPVKFEVQEGIKLAGISNISFSNINSKSVQPWIIQGNKETVIRDISLNNVKISTAGEEALNCSNCANIKFNNVELENL